MTVPAAKTTAPPEVAVTRATDSRGSMPCEIVAVAGHDEQRVVDSHPEPNHGREGGRRGRHLHAVAEEGDDAEAHGKAKDRGEDGDTHRDGRAEREQQDEHGRREPDHLGDVGRWLGYLLAEVAARGRVQPGFVERLVEAYYPLGLFDAQLRGAVLEVEGDVADRMLLVELATTLPVERADGLGDRRVLGVGFGDPLDRLLVLASGEFGSFRGPESDRDRAVGLVGELAAEQVACGLAVGAGQLDVVVGLLADAPGHTHDYERDHHPDRKDPHGVTGAEMTQTVEQRRQYTLLMV